MTFPNYHPPPFQIFHFFFKPFRINGIVCKLCPIGFFIPNYFKWFFLCSVHSWRGSHLWFQKFWWKLIEKWKFTTSFVFGCCSTPATFVNFTTVHIATNWYRALKLLEYLLMNACTLGRYNSWSYWVFHSCQLKYQYHLPIPRTKNCCPWSKEHISHWMDKIIYGPLHKPSPRTTNVDHP